MKTLVLGLGNPILSDDGAGIQVANKIQELVDQREITVMETSSGGLGLLDILTGYDKAIIVDTIQTVEGMAGQIYRLESEAFNTTRYATSPHDVNFATALELGSRLGLALPRQIIIFAIEVADTTTFSDECTPDVKKAIPVCVDMVIRELDGNNNNRPGGKNMDDNKETEIYTKLDRLVKEYLKEEITEKDFTNIERLSSVLSYRNTLNLVRLTKNLVEYSKKLDKFTMAIIFLCGALVVFSVAMVVVVALLRL